MEQLARELMLEINGAANALKLGIPEFGGRQKN